MTDPQPLSETEEANLQKLLDGARDGYVKAAIVTAFPRLLATIAKLRRDAEVRDATLALVVKELEQYSLPTHPSMTLEEKVCYRVGQVHFAIANLRAVESAAAELVCAFDEWCDAPRAFPLDGPIRDLRAALAKSRGKK